VADKPKEPSMEMPSIALAKAGLKPGSKEWIMAMAKEHGDTNPLKVEHRRERMSAWAVTVERCIGQIQDAKRTLPIETEKELQAFLELRHRTMPAEVHAVAAFAAETEYQIQARKIGLQQQLLQYEIVIAQLTADLAKIEGHCLTVDCLSNRMKAKDPKTGKKGYSRYTSAWYLEDVGWHMGALYDMVCELLRKQPGEAGDEEEEREANEEDIVSPEEQEKLRKEKLDAQQQRAEGGKEPGAAV
jgi:hypothetical protein